MAIVLGGEKKQISWKLLTSILVVLIVLGGGIYFLFFAPTPVIEVIAPPAVRSTAELSGLRFDPAGVVNSDAFKSLRRYIDKPPTAETGRTNPFIEF